MPAVTNIATGQRDYWVEQRLPCTCDQMGAEECL